MHHRQFRHSFGAKPAFIFTRQISPTKTAFFSPVASIAGVGHLLQVHAGKFHFRGIPHHDTVDGSLDQVLHEEEARGVVPDPRVVGPRPRLPKTEGSGQKGGFFLM